MLRNPGMASGAGLIGDIFGWRAVFFFTGAIDLVASPLPSLDFEAWTRSLAVSTYRL